MLAPVIRECGRAGQGHNVILLGIGDMAVGAFPPFALTLAV
jgi:hypothetical protein